MLKWPAPAPLSPEKAFRIRCYTNGISDPRTVAELWAEERKRMAAARPKKRKRR